MAKVAPDFFAEPIRWARWFKPQTAKVLSDHGLAMARLEALLHLIDDVHLALAPHEAVGAVTTTQRFQRIPDFHFNTDANDGGRDRDRTCDPYDVNVVLYR